MNSRGPTWVQAQSFRAKTVKIRSVNNKLHRKKKNQKNQKKKKKKTKLAIYAVASLALSEGFLQL